MEGIQTLLNLFTSKDSPVYDRWTAASSQAAISLMKKRSHAQRLRQYAKTFISQGKILTNGYGTWVKAKIETDEEFAEELKLFLQSVGKYVKAQDLVEYLHKLDVQEKYGLKAPISLSTAKKWMKKMDYRWVKNHKGQYVDGHERSDVVHYRQNTFLPVWYSFEQRMHSWEGEKLTEVPTKINNGSRRVVAWFHDESIFYAHDR